MLRMILALMRRIAMATEDGVLLKPKNPFNETKLSDVTGCLLYEGEAKPLAEMDDAVSRGIQEQWQ